MTRAADVIIVGGGIGGLCAAIVLGGRGLNVHLVEQSTEVGGKAGTVNIDGVEVDTGPSVLTLPHVFDEVFEAAGMSRSSEITLTRPSPGFRYLYQDGTCLDVFHERDDTVASVRAALGSVAAQELTHYLDYAQRIWSAAAPHFVYNEAPNLSGLLFGGLGKWAAVSKIDPFRTLSGAIDSHVRSHHLRMLLRRYATYNGSDARTAPATLGCIAHVELALGGYGVKGGMIELVRALTRAAEKVGVRFQLETAVERIETSSGAISGVRLVGGEFLAAPAVVANADVAQLVEKLLDAPKGLKSPSTLSMSAHTGVVRASRTAEPRVAHTVLFPGDYEAEFRDIFDRGRVPAEPTVYLCAQEACHQRTGWQNEEPVFLMVNAPAQLDMSGQESGASVSERVKGQLTRAGLLLPTDHIMWWRTPADLAARFSGSHGALYGAASNSKAAAFQRPSNRSTQIPGLYLASGGAHPGGGVPMVALSGRQAARALLADRSGAA